jgi:hypothetical protein
MSDITGEGCDWFEPSVTLEMRRTVRDIEVWIENRIANVKCESMRITLNRIFTDILIVIHKQKKTDPLTVPLEVWEAVREKWEPVIHDTECVTWRRCSMCDYVDGINSKSVEHRSSMVGSCTNKKNRCPLVDMDFCNSDVRKSKLNIAFWKHRYPYNMNYARAKHRESIRCFIRTIDIIIDTIKKRDGIDNN